MSFPEMSIQMVLPSRMMAADEIFNFRVYMAIIAFVFMSLAHLPVIEQSKFASIIGLARQILFYVPVMVFLPKWLGIKGELSNMDVQLYKLKVTKGKEDIAQEWLSYLKANKKRL